MGIVVATIGSRLDAFKGLAPGSDFLRLALAIGVVLWHEREIMFGRPDARNVVISLLGPTILPMFFALSGFLICASAQRLSLRQFLVNRSLRIFPALCVEVLLCAVLLGSIFTALPLKDYFSSPGTYRYLTNCIGLINFTLPGVFTSNPSSTVNWSIWTIPCELTCYAIMSAIIWLDVLASTRRVILFCLILGAAIAVLYINGPRISAVLHIFQPTIKYLTTSGLGLLIPFVMGVLGYVYRYRISFNRPALLAALVPVAMLLIIRGDIGRYPILFPFLAVSLTYLVMYVSLCRIPLPPGFGSGDYSYGIYLYGAPLQQAVRAALPNLDNGAAYLAIAIAVIALFAALSWHLVEKPILRMRKRFSFVARARGVG
ncbi:MAG TPA: acyltransferase [Allosphingosinicella sp.]|jgi:peptidoglycan/LPS O-acetylase OafA/YrhL